jgi:hypothetical protein
MKSLMPQISAYDGYGVIGGTNVTLPRAFKTYSDVHPTPNGKKYNGYALWYWLGLDMANLYAY